MITKNSIDKYGLGTFIILTFALTFTLSTLGTWERLATLLPRTLQTTFLVLMHYMPSGVAILLVGLSAGKNGLKHLLGRLCVWRVSLRWYMFILLYPLVVRLLAVGIHLLMGGQVPAFFTVGDPSIPVGNPMVMFLPIFLGIFFQAGLAEEIGWRGFALPRLQERYNALTSSLVLGMIWALWHFHPQNFTHLLPGAGWYILGTLSFTVIFTWVFNHTNGSLLIAVLFHTASNTSDWIVPIGIAVAGEGFTGAYPAFLTIQVMFSICLVLIFGAKHLTRQPRITQEEENSPARQKAKL